MIFRPVLACAAAFGLAACLPVPPANEAPTATLAPDPAGVDTALTGRFAAELSYVNISGAPLPVFADAAATRQTGTLAPGKGGSLQACLPDRDFCKITLHDGRTVWLDASALGGNAS